MTLLTTVFAAIIVTILWYKKLPDRTMQLGTLALMFWGASIMWSIDAVFEFAELHEEYFTPAPADMLNDLFLGLSVIALGLIIWLVIILIRDPKGVVRENLIRKRS